MCNASPPQVDGSGGWQGLTMPFDTLCVATNTHTDSQVHRLTSAHTHTNTHAHIHAQYMDTHTHTYAYKHVQTHPLTCICTQPRTNTAWETVLKAAGGAHQKRADGARG